MTEPTERVGDLARDLPHACRIFEKHGIDYCCGGKRSLREACSRAGAPLEQVLAALDRAPATSEPFTRWDRQPLDGLVRHIVEKHHGFLREELPRITALSEKVARVHGGRHAYLAQVAESCRSLREELSLHLDKEERVLFPYVVALAEAVESGRRPSYPPFQTAAGPIRCMDEEHDDAGKVLAALRGLSGGYAPPKEACATWRALYAALAELEADLHQHIHLESNVLFPRTLELEASLLGLPRTPPR